MSTVIEVDDVWKKYRLGIIGTGTLRHDFERWWHRVRGKPDPLSKVDQTAIRGIRKIAKSGIGHQRLTIGSLAVLGGLQIWATTRCGRCGKCRLK